MTRTLTAAENTRYQQCLNETSGSTTAYYAVKIFTLGLGGGNKPQRKSIGECNLEIIDARNKTTSAAAAATMQKTAAAQPPVNVMLMLIGSGIMNVIAVGIIISCLLTAVIFLGLRFIVIWVLLAVSPLAWATYAIPGNGFFSRWWKNFWAWNVFGPIYLFSLIPGMIMLQGSGDVLTALIRAGGDVGGGNGSRYGAGGGHGDDNAGRSHDEPGADGERHQPRRGRGHGEL